MQLKRTIIFLSAVFALGALALSHAADFPVPIEKKIIHSTPPSEFAGKKNPFTALVTFVDPTKVYDTVAKQSYMQIVERGGELYRANCAPCHGIKSNGRGPQASGFYPPPADFTNPETIGALKENYLLWRVKEGGREEPFKSAMPAFGDDLTDEEIWSIIMYEYKNAGVQPKS